MREEPEQRIERTAINVWRTHGLITAIILLILVGAVFAVSYWFEWPYWISAIGLGVTLVIAIIHLGLIPPIRWRRWRYQLYDQEIYIQHGIIIVKRTLVPMIRVQHVDTKQGPILKKFNLSTLQVSTAATTHSIPALTVKEAERLRDQISILARVDQDDI
ncbi:hypothetical protein SAMN05421734_106130 [Pelagirhabdus alkalitolerans]|uniref:YdbS-like PH domain-containing protein n=1 Tax=Pelagirhabdus alkalitolerans TaxID=1612202 RepID=A0A1G6KLK2_9BACI|nr:PH domain-containing protein [Pelagirhabdus alkalitolerans]SDC31797.1 hypothetical protein SAMN05421734_106130 [Pelagirhabdus alkalitolerans]